MEITGETSDGYHTFNELYDHRIALFIALCASRRHLAPSHGGPWRSRLHSDGSSLPGWFVMGLGETAGEQITYHLPDTRWDDAVCAVTLDRAPTFDGHTSADVLTRLMRHAR